MIGRRDFIAGLGSAVAWPVVGRAQQPAVPVIGWLSNRNANTDDLVLPAFRQALAARGYVEGRNLKVEYRFADGVLDRLPALARDLVRSGVALVLAVGGGASTTRAVRGVSTTIPVVFVTGSDPVGVGLVPSYKSSCEQHYRCNGHAGPLDIQANGAPAPIAAKRNVSRLA